MAKEYVNWDPLTVPEYRQATVGSGTIGGKAKGLLFAREVLATAGVPALARVKVPESLFLGTGLFREQMACSPGKLCPKLVSAVELVLSRFECPLAIRSSSKLEDSLKFSFAGKYLTVFVPNRGTWDERFAQVCSAILAVYDSTFNDAAVQYRRKHGLEGEEMAVIVQPLIGEERLGYFYPDVSGVGFSKNYRRWTERIRKEDGMVRVVFGLGTKCVGRGYARTFSLTNPWLRPEGFDPYVIARYSQETMDALDLTSGELVSFNINRKRELVRCHRNFGDVAQIFSQDAKELRDVGPGDQPGPGERYVFTFRKFVERYPEFFSTCRALFKVLEDAMGTPVDIEFVYDLAHRQFWLVQARPLSAWEENRRVRVPSGLPSERVLLKADRMLTNGQIEGVRHLVWVDPQAYLNCSQPYAVAREVGEQNEKFANEGYILVGPGRWGSSDPAKGVPVRYNEINHARLLVEVGIIERGIIPELSYGTHFFADLDMDRILYMPVFQGLSSNVVNWEWFANRTEWVSPSGVVKVYDGCFDAYLDGEGMVGVVLDSEGTSNWHSEA
ncbi:MAG: PEP/pyruvate-binding domain-containing protein [Bacillota bacterium]